MRGRGRGSAYYNFITRELKKRQENNSTTSSNDSVPKNETIQQTPANSSRAEADSSKEVSVASNVPTPECSKNKKLSDINQITKDIVSSGIQIMQNIKLKKKSKDHLSEIETTSQCSDTSRMSTESLFEKRLRHNKFLINARKRARLETLAKETQIQNVSSTTDEPKAGPSKEAIQPMETVTEPLSQPLENATEPVKIANIYHSESGNTANAFPSWGSFVSTSSQLNKQEQWHLPGALEMGKYIKVTVNFVMDTYAYVMDVRDKDLFFNMTKSINADNKTIPVKHVINGALCYLEFDQTMHRGVVSHTDDCYTDVQLIDFGPETRINKNAISKELFEVYDSDVKSYRPFACSVKVAFRNDFKFVRGNTYYIKVISQIDNCYMVFVKGLEPFRHPEILYPIKSPLDYLHLNSKGMMRIEHRFCYNKATASLETSVANKIASDLRAGRHELAIDGYYSFSKNSIVVCKSPSIEQGWARGKILSLWGRRNVVAMLDTGRVHENCEFYTHPPIHQITPPQSFIITLKNIISDCFEDYMKPGRWLVYIVEKVYPNIEIVCMTRNKLNLFRAEVTPWSVNIDQCRLVNTPALTYFRQSRIFEVENAYTVYLKSEENELADRYDAIVAAVERYAKSSKVRCLMTMPVRNDMVLCFCDAIKKYCRAIVKRAENVYNIRVLYTELGKEEVVTFNNIRELPDTLKADPMYLLKVQLLNVPKKEDDAAVGCLVNTDETFTLKINMDYYPDVELCYRNKTTLNEQITKIMSETRCFLEDTFVTISYDHYFEIYVMDNSQIIYGSIYATSNSLNRSKLCQNVLIDLHAELVSTYDFVDMTPYVPVTREIVAARFPGESWRRAVCIKVGYGEYENKFLLRNLDCGGVKWIPLNYIRKMNKKFLKKPYLTSKITFDWLYQPVAPEQATSLAGKFLPGMVKKCTLRKTGPGEYAMSKYWS